MNQQMTTLKKNYEVLQFLIYNELSLMPLLLKR
jgi:hypothetical protein